MVRWLLIVWLAGCADVLQIQDTTPTSADPDHDGFADTVDDNCPGVNNPDQGDRDGDDIGDACDGFCKGTCTDAATCLCLDFDDGVLVPTPWTTHLGCNGSASINPTDVQSPPAAAFFSLPASTMDQDIGCPHAVIQGGLNTSLRHVLFEVAWKRPSYGPGDLYSIVQYSSISLSSGAAYTLNNEFGGSVKNRWYIGQTILGTSKLFAELPDPPTDQSRWMRLGYDIVFSDTPSGHLVITYDGIEVLRLDNIVTAPPSPDTQTISVTIGVGKIVGYTPTAVTLHDNVLVRVD